MPEARAALVLIHGAWHGPWCWQRLVPHLATVFSAVHRLALPSVDSPDPAGLAEDVRHLNDALRRISGPVILCGHSYGGLVVACADPDAADIRHRVYLAAYLADPGESMEASLRSAGERRPGHWIRRRPDGRTEVDAARAAERFYADCDTQTQNWAVAQLRPHWAQAFTQTAGSQPGRTQASTYIVCRDDQVLPARIQRDTYAPRVQHLLTLDGGHSPFLSQPQVLARALVSIRQ
jgi:pimeloyl-ACP methyl ester carboxylesterase